MSGTTVRRPARLAAVAVAVVLAVGLGACTGSAGSDRVATPTLSVTPSTTPTQPVHGASPLGAKWDWPRAGLYQTYLQQVTGTRTFYEMVWCDQQLAADKPVDWTTTDRVVQESNALGITMMLKIRVGLCWATGGKAQFTRGNKNKTESAMPKDMGEYTKFVTSVVRRYSAMGVKEFAVENEINSRSFWAGTPDDYRTLVTAASQAIHQADPSAEVVDAGLSSTSYGYGIAQSLLSAGNGAEAVKAYSEYYQRRIGTRGGQLPAVTTPAQLQGVLGSDQGKRNLAYLALMTSLAQGKVVDVRQVHFYEPWTNVPRLLAYLKATTPASTPIEAWEVGQFWKGSDAEDTERSNEIVKSLTLLLGGGLRAAIWLPLAFNPGGRNGDEPRYGLLNADGSERVAGQMMAAMVVASRGATARSVTTHGLTGVAFDHGASTDLFVWAAGTSARLTLDAGDAIGGVGTKPAAKAAKSTVQVGTAPVEVSVPTALDTFLGAQ
jgi:hypothetical protein